MVWRLEQRRVEYLFVRHEVISSTRGPVYHQVTFWARSNIQTFKSTEIQRIRAWTLANKPGHNFYHVICKTIETSILNVNSNRFPRPVIIGTFKKWAPMPLKKWQDRAGCVLQVKIKINFLCLFSLNIHASVLADKETWKSKVMLKKFRPTPKRPVMLNRGPCLFLLATVMNTLTLSFLSAGSNTSTCWVTLWQACRDKLCIILI